MKGSSGSRKIRSKSPGHHLLEPDLRFDFGRVRPGRIKSSLRRKAPATHQRDHVVDKPDLADCRGYVAQRNRSQTQLAARLRRRPRIQETKKSSAYSIAIIKKSNATYLSMSSCSQDRSRNRYQRHREYRTQLSSFNLRLLISGRTTLIQDASPLREPAIAVAPKIQRCPMGACSVSPFRSENQPTIVP